MKERITPPSAVFKDVYELSQEIGLSRSKTYQGLRDGSIPSIRIGKRFIVPRAAIQDWLYSCEGKIRDARTENLPNASGPACKRVNGGVR